MRQFDVISLDIKEIPNQMITWLEKEASWGITYQEEIMHDQLIKSQEKITQAEEEIDHMKKE